MLSSFCILKKRDHTHTCTRTCTHTQVTLSTETVATWWAGGLLSVPKLNRAELVGFLFIGLCLWDWNLWPSEMHCRNANHCTTGHDDKAFVFNSVWSYYLRKHENSLAVRLAFSTIIWLFHKDKSPQKNPRNILFVVFSMSYGCEWQTQQSHPINHQLSPTVRWFTQIWEFSLELKFWNHMSSHCFIKLLHSLLRISSCLHFNYRAHSINFVSFFLSNLLSTYLFSGLRCG